MVIGKCHLGVELGMDIVIEEAAVCLGEDILGKCKIIEVRITEVDAERAIEMAILEEVEVGPGNDNTQSNFRGVDQGSSRSRLGSRASTNRDRIRCFKCREYDHFAKDCLNSEADKVTEQIQQMYNLDTKSDSIKGSSTIHL